LARSTSHPSEQAPAGEPVFGLVSPASRLDVVRMPPVLHGCPLRPFGGARDGLRLAAALLRRLDLGRPRRPPRLRLAASAPVGPARRCVRSPRLPASTLDPGPRRHVLAAGLHGCPLPPSAPPCPGSRLAPFTRAVHHPPDRRTSWPHSGSASACAFVLPRWARSPRPRSRTVQRFAPLNFE
jgi:hypothetical protein